jgi:hypothetical protein
MVLTSRPVLSGVASGPLLLGNGGDEALHFANYIVLGLLIVDDERRDRLARLNLGVVRRRGLSPRGSASKI